MRMATRFSQEEARFESRSEVVEERTGQDSDSRRRQFEQQERIEEQRRKEESLIASKKKLEEKRMMEQRQSEMQQQQQQQQKHRRMQQEAEKRRLADERKLAEEHRLAEEKRLADEQRLLEERRKAKMSRAEEELRIKEEQKNRFEQERRTYEEKKRQERERMREEFKTEKEQCSSGRTTTKLQKARSFSSQHDMRDAVVVREQFSKIKTGQVSETKDFFIRSASTERLNQRQGDRQPRRRWIGEQDWIRRRNLEEQASAPSPRGPSFVDSFGKWSVGRRVVTAAELLLDNRNFPL